MMHMNTMPKGLLCAALLAPCALLADYANEFNVKFTGYAGSTTLTNFPALVCLSAARNGFDYSKCKLADGGDTRFFDAAGNLLPSEVDTWNPDGESLVWVSVPELKPEQHGYTTITVKYGNASPDAVTPTDVWTNGYVGVWHMSAATGKRTQYDATENGKNVTCPSGYADAVQSGVQGKIGLAARCGLRADGLGGFEISDSGFFDGWGEITIEAWTFRDDGAAKPTVNGTIIEKSRYTGTWLQGWSMYEQSGSEKIGCWFYRSNGNGTWMTAPSDAPTQGEWHYHARRWSGTTGVNSRTLDASTTSSGSAPATPEELQTVPNGSLCIGNCAANSNGKKPFPGVIDEVRVSNVFRSEDWVKASYDTVSNPDFAVADIPNDWTKYPHKFSLAFPGVADGATLTDFPVLVKISESGIPGFSYADCVKEGGADLRFADASGALLPCEVEVWNTNGVSLVWVKIPTLTKDTRITAYYGWNFAPSVAATDVWDANFIAVWHMNAASDSLSQHDATANSRTVTLSSSYADNIIRGVDGIVGTAADFGHRADGKGNYGRSNSDGAFDGLTTATFEFWTKQEIAPTNKNSYVFYCGQASPTVNAYSMYQSKGGSTAGAYYNEARTYVWGGSATTPLNEWNHHAFRYDGINGKTSYIQNNVLKHDTSDSNVNGHHIDAVKSQICIGSFTTYFTDNANYVGLLDEVRISSVARSDAWVKATHDTIANNATFTQYGNAGANIRSSVVTFR